MTEIRDIRWIINGKEVPESEISEALGHLPFDYPMLQKMTEAAQADAHED